MNILEKLRKAKLNRRAVKRTTRILRDSAKVRKYCKKHYPGWEDNEFNSGDLKFLWGLPQNPEAGSAASFCTLNYATLYYSRFYNTYYLDIDVSEAKTMKFYDFLSLLVKIDEGLEEAICKEYHLTISQLYDNFSIPNRFDLAGENLTEVYNQWRMLLTGLLHRTGVEV